MKQTIMSAGLHSIDRFQVHISPMPLYYIALKITHFTTQSGDGIVNATYHPSVVSTSLPLGQWLGAVCTVAMCTQWFSSFYVQMILYPLSTSGNMEDFLWRLDPGWVITGIHLILLVSPTLPGKGG